MGVGVPVAGGQGLGSESTADWPGGLCGAATPCTSPTPATRGSWHGIWPEPGLLTAAGRGNRPMFVQIQRILSINELTLVISDVVEAARTTLVIGDTGP